MPTRRRGSWTALAVSMLTLVSCTDTPPPQSPAALAMLPSAPRLVYVSVASDRTFHRVLVSPLPSPGTGAFETPLVCERVYVGGHRGVCLTPDDQQANRWWAQVFDGQFQPLTRIALTGAPSRVRVSPDGSLAAATMFESGHSYAEHGFSTRTSLVDLIHGRLLGDLEQFETTRDGAVFKAEDFNFWGVTFTSDSDTFYATLDTSGVSYLVKGSVRDRRMSVVRAGVECPSLSPDGSRIAFKKRVGARSLGWWQIAVLDLRTSAETIVKTETRSVDDQVEWLDGDRVVYHMTDSTTAADLWAVRVDNSAAPERLLASAYSPAVVR